MKNVHWLLWWEYGLMLGFSVKETRTNYSYRLKRKGEPAPSWLNECRSEDRGSKNGLCLYCDATNYWCLC